METDARVSTGGVVSARVTPCRTLGPLLPCGHLRQFAPGSRSPLPCATCDGQIFADRDAKISRWGLWHTLFDGRTRASKELRVFVWVVRTA